MKTKSQSPSASTGAFTLIELLVVIAIIAILAAITFPTVSAIKNRQTLTKAEAERDQVVAAIENYKTELGHYPPGTSKNSAQQYAINPLYFELAGAVQNGANFESKDGSANILGNVLQPQFGRDGFVNCTRSDNADDVKPAKKFLGELRSGQFVVVSNTASSTAKWKLLTCSVKWKFDWPYSDVWPAEEVDFGTPSPNPWRYNATNPTNNPGGFDLWVDIYVGGKTQRVSNWSKKPQLVN